MKTIDELKDSVELNEMLVAIQKTNEWKEIEKLGGDPFDVVATYAPHVFEIHPDNAELRISFIVRKLKGQIEILNALDNRGIILGTVDDDVQPKKNRPETYALLLKTGELRKVASFDHNLVTKPGIYTLGIRYDAERDNYIAHKCLEYKPLQKNPCEFFDGVAITTDSEAWDDGTIDATRYQVVAIRGEISSLYPMPVFGEAPVYDDEGNLLGVENKIVGYNPIYQPNGRSPIPNMCPVLKVNLSPASGTNYISVNFGKTVYGIPFFGVDNFESVLKYAVEANDDPIAQVRDIEYMFENPDGTRKEVIIVGYVTRMKQGRNKDGDDVNSITVRGIALLDPSARVLNKMGEADVNGASDAVAEASAVSTPKAKRAKTSASKPPLESVLTVEAEIIDIETPIKDATPSTVDEVVEEPVATPVVEESVEEIVEETPADSSNNAIPQYNENAPAFMEYVITTGSKICKLLHHDAEQVTVEFVKASVPGVDKQDVPAPIWKQLVSAIKNSL